MWLHCPEFLSKESAYWPVQPVNVQAKEELCELKSAKPTVSSLLNTCTEKQEANLESIINPESYSSLTKLIRVTSLVLLFVKKLKRRRDGSTDQEESLQVYKQAEKKWIKHVQKGILNSDKYQQMKPTIEVGDVVCVYKDKAPRQLWSMGVVKSLITGRDGYHRGAVVRVRSGDRVVEMTRPLNRLYPVEVESQVREERQNRNTDFPITFVGNAEQEHVSEH